jgi:hypothetical protein
MAAGFTTPLGIGLLVRIGGNRHAATITPQPSASDQYHTVVGGRLIDDGRGTLARWIKRRKLLRDDEEILLLLSACE